MKRKKNNLMDNLDAMDEWVMENGGTSMKAKLLNWALTALEHQLDKVIVLYDQHLGLRRPHHQRYEGGGQLALQRVLQVAEYGAGIGTA